MAEESESESEVLMEVEAVEAVYGSDCIILESFPPHLRLHINPRTADVHSQQFVEATIEIRATAQYPSDPPSVDIIGSKGLDEERLKHLSASLHEKTRELSSCLMLVALCEEAVETLSSMNHPEGDCPLCLYPLVPEGEDSRSLPFMKLMSCFHCFHCECIIRWLKWIRQQNEADSGATTVVSSTLAEETKHVSDICEMMVGSTGNCPVCRKVFLAKDIEHVLNSVDSHSANMDDEKELSEKLLQCDLEKSRRQKFEAILESQQQRGGLIEPPKDNILFSRLSLQELVVVEEAANEERIEQQQGDQTTPSSEVGSSNHDHTLEPTTQTHTRRSTQPGSGGSRGRSRGGDNRRNSDARKHGSGSSRGVGNPRPQNMHWTRRKE